MTQSWLRKALRRKKLKELIREYSDRRHLAYYARLIEVYERRLEKMRRC